MPKVSKGLATWAGVVAAAGQYAAAVAVFLDDPDKATALGPLGTATVTLAVVIYGRMSQAREATKRAPLVVPAPPVVYSGSGANVSSGTVMTGGYAGSTPRPHAGGSFTPLATSSPEEGGDPDALPDYSTAENPPPDEGDMEAGAHHE